MRNFLKVTGSGRSVKPESIKPRVIKPKLSRLTEQQSDHQFSVQVHIIKLLKCIMAASLFASLNVNAIDKAPDQWALMSDLVTKSLLVDITKHGQRIFACGERGHIVYSDDDGNSWVQGKVPTVQMITAIDFPTAQEGWAVGHDGNIYHSTDGGQNWVIQYDGLAHKAESGKVKLNQTQTILSEKKKSLAALQQSLLNADDKKKAKIESQIADVKYEIEQTEADVGSYEAELTNTVEIPWLDVLFRDANYGLVIGAFGRAMVTADGGKSWTSIKDSISNPDEYHLNSIEGTTDGKLIIGGEVGTLYSSMDWGKTWKNLESPYDGSFFGLTIDEQTNAILVFGISGALFRSTDLGKSWTHYELELPNSLNGGIFTANGGATVVGVGGYLLRSNDKGVNMDIEILPRRQHMNKVIETATGRQIAVGQGGVFILPDSNSHKVAAASDQTTSHQ